MSTFASLLAENPIPTEPRVTPIRADVHVEAVPRVASLREEQIQTLVDQLFFRSATGPVRHVGFVGSEPWAETTQLCLEVARVLADQGQYDVGLVDARPGAVPLQNQLEITPPTRPEPTWPIAPRLRLVPRHSWLSASEGQRVPENSFFRLRELTVSFDFGILCCPPVSWLTTRIGRSCDGLVLVLTANRTRRLVAAQMRDMLQQAQVPLLGTVLTERRLPVPEGLYRKL